MNKNLKLIIILLIPIIWSLIEWNISFSSICIIISMILIYVLISAKNISYIFQAYNLVETLTVYENIVLPLQIQGKNIKKHQDKIVEIMDKLAIQNLKDKFPNQLSGGQRQRVATARALIDDSKLIIADEPTGALDSANSEKLMVLLQEINKSFGITILLVTHDPAAAKYSSRMVLLSDGKIMDDLERNSLSNEQYLKEIYSRTR